MPITLSIILAIVGLIIQIANKVSEKYKEHIEKIPYLKTALFWASIVIILFGSYGTINSMLQKKRYEVAAAPSEIKLKHQRNKNVDLKVTNNQDFSIFDAHLGICTDNKDLDLSLISLKHVKKIENPGAFFSAFRYDFSNACRCIVLGSINAHSTKEYHVRLQGEKLKKDSLISFTIYYWSKEPSQFDIPITKDQYSNPPKNFKDHFSKKSEMEPKTASAYYQNLKAPTNPYLGY